MAKKVVKKPTKKGGGGFGNLIKSALSFVVLAAIVVGVAKVNNIHSVKDVYRYFKSWSDKTAECVEGGSWNCDTPIVGEGGAGGNTGSDGSGGISGEGDLNPAEKVKVPVSESLDKLNSLKVADSVTVNYQRKEWKHWVQIEGECNTRETALVKQGQNVVTDDKCRVVSGSWFDPYTGQTFTDAKKLDIDHVIPLGYAARNGGQEWSAEKKQQFANDLDIVLLAVSATENRSKSDKGPADYMPPRKDYECDYAKRWVDISVKYDLSVPQKDKDRLTQALNTCKN